MKALSGRNRNDSSRPIAGDESIDAGIGLPGRQSGSDEGLDSAFEFPQILSNGRLRMFLRDQFREGRFTCQRGSNGSQILRRRGRKRTGAHNLVKNPIDATQRVIVELDAIQNGTNVPLPIVVHDQPFPFRLYNL